MSFKIYRDGDARFRLRKVVVELYGPDGHMLNRCRIFAGLLFILRLKFKMSRMARLGRIMQAYTTV